MTEGLHPLCLLRKVFLSDSSISSLVHSDMIVSLNSDDSVSHLFCWFSSCEKIAMISPNCEKVYEMKESYFALPRI